jgi:large conductance mechanosensitive channel protein
MLEGFKKFIMRGNVLDLAVGVIIGGAFGAIVNSLVADIITPLIGMIFGAPQNLHLLHSLHKPAFPLTSSGGGCQRPRA